MKRFSLIVCCALLLAPLVWPQGLGLLGLGVHPRAADAPGPWPPASLAVTDFQAWATRTATAYADNFPFRESMIRTLNRLRLAVWGESPMRTLIRGRECWWFYNDEMALEDWMGATRFDPQELADNVRLHQERRDWLAARGIAMLVVIVPNKKTVYGEFLPSSLRKMRETTRLDQLARAMEEGGIPFLDLRPVMLRAKAVRQAYWKTDSHWNEWGALAGCSAIVEKLRERFPAMPPLDPAAYTAVAENTPGGDLAAMMLLENQLPEANVRMVPHAPHRAHDAPPPPWKDPADLPGRRRIVKAVDDNSLPRALFFRDSFGSQAIPFLAERFRRSVFLWTHRFNPGVVLAERPDVVIFEAAERYQHAIFSPSEGGRP
ncbi:putative alginate O-acetylase AlgJ [Fundidesulfovibrio magnetotacticus]|uniref:Putative alginate O-acetylase AlgJ n=1 Tax=Fundidesulfovibrio magnetotacticus TaxID=2730080 RepID=A0A6V8LLZ8_9BACT|nr:hypothetical protein [Fundidesulfovibrio magnetotacticus]GFK93702.1 putative alginate O-acetylase AlgJ [Fundidesulfovibrio magnetotacticus]